MAAPVESVNVGRWPSAAQSQISDAAMSMPPYAAYVLKKTREAFFTPRRRLH